MVSLGQRRAYLLGWFLLLAALIYLNFNSRWRQNRYSDVGLAKLMAERLWLVDHVCHKYNHTLLQQYTWWLGQTSEEWSAVNASLLANPDLLVDRQHRIAWCKVPKVASTSIAFALLREIGQGRLTEDQQLQKPRGQRHTILRGLMPSPRLNEDVSFCTAFMVIRHPLQRILSAYRDKFLNRREFTQFRKFQRDYGSVIIDLHRHQHPPRLLPEYSDVPTFWEFVEYLGVTPVWEYNEHWRPYYLTCTPCHHHYSIILHLENLMEETQYLVHLTGLRDLVLHHHHVTSQSNTNGNLDVRHNRSNTHESSRNTEEIFYSQIDEGQLNKLYEIYKIDFEMFGYDLAPYDTYVKAAARRKK